MSSTAHLAPALLPVRGDSSQRSRVETNLISTQQAEACATKFGSLVWTWQGVPDHGCVSLAREGLSLPAGDITVLLDRWTRGDDQAVDALTPLVYSHLRKVASSYLRRERPDHTLEATSLVNELFLVLLKDKRAQFEDRVHFFTFAARAMRRILVNHARTRGTAKRGSAEAHFELSPDLAWVDPESPEMLDLDRALDQMESMEPRKARVVELRIFLGCTSAEAADLMGISKPTLDRDLRFALAWLFDRMKGSA